MPYPQYTNGSETETQPTANPVLTVAATYVTGDYVGTSGAAMEFTGCASHGGGGGYVLGATLVDKALQSVAGELWLFRSAVTPPADSAAWTITDVDAAKLICVIPFSTYHASAANSVTTGAPDSGAKRYILPSGATSIYGCFVTRGAPAYASLDLVFNLDLLQD